MIETFLEWMGSTGWSVALLESLYVWSFMESAHVLGIALFVGTAVVNDLRLLVVSFKNVPASEVTQRLLWWTRARFALMVVTGLLVFYSNPLRYWHNINFRIKLILLVVAGLNVWLFHSRIHKRVSEWDLDAVPPRAARIAAAVSLCVWALVVITGRMIAYNWFDCDLQPQSDFVNWAQGCVLPTE